MEYIGYLAPIAFVFALGAYSMAAKLQKEVEQLRKELQDLRSGR